MRWDRWNQFLQIWAEVSETGTPRKMSSDKTSGATKHIVKKGLMTNIQVRKHPFTKHLELQNVCAVKASGDKTFSNKMSGDKMSGDKTSGDKTPGVKTFHDKKFGDKTSGNKVFGDKTSML
jgi:hypothetical protein